MLYNIVKNSILQNKKIKQAGGFIGVTNPFTRLSDYIPLIAERGHSIGILGATGSGKSRFTRWLYLYHVYKFYKETGYPVKVIYFPLEDSKEKVMRNVICHYMKELYNITINLQELDSKGKKELPDFILKKLELAEDFFKDFEEVVTIVDGLNQPTEIFNYCKDYAMATGKIETYKIDKKGQEKTQMRYVANNDVHTIVIVDNMSNIDIEEGTADERQAIVKFCKTYVRGRLCNFFNFTVVQVLQQDFASERQSFNQNGETLITKLEPSLAGVGDSKTITRSMHLVFGIFHPARFNIIAYPPITKFNTKAYRLDILGNKFRSLHILKANDVDFGQRIAFSFDAVSEIMKEMPELDSQELEDMYRKIQENKPEKFAKINAIKYEVDEQELEEAPF